MKNVYLTNKLLLGIRKYLCADLRVQLLDDTKSSNFKSVEIMATTVFDKVDKNFLSQFPNLKIISQFGIGLDNINLDYAAENKIKVTNTPDVVTNATAEMAIALLLAVTRKILLADQYVRKGRWSNGGALVGNNVFGKKVGIVGLGRVGSRIAEILTAFGCEINYFGQKPKHISYKYYDNVSVMAAYVDILIVSCAAVQETFHLIDQKVLKNLGSTGLFVNVSRGSVVDEKALIVALKSSKILGAGLDVFENEPNINSEFFKLRNVVLQPHQGTATQETRDAMYQNVANDLNKFI